ncbi:hypothetical protein INT44_001620 [Umbelopsis vinacea]|uniref:C2H2-type domain-containing protein n=1 Tax=Umbelopsis vinacea TaxID=44442 RepID=A0A8H7PRB3_9FUNG|nr:hypothetical protein INT44_001620 [Umbelopsis vinacea]
MPAPIEVSYSRRLSYIKYNDLNLDLQTSSFGREDGLDNFPSQDLETTFCRNFSCCGLVLQDLHDLLQHYEESHVRFEDDDSSALYSDSWSNSDSSAPNSPQLLSRQLSMEAVRKRDADDLTSDDDDMAAFDTSVLRNNDEVVAEFSPSKKLKLSIPTSSFADVPTVALSNEDFLAQANALFASAANQSNIDKPYKCPVQGCDKAYKNPNGLKYHNQHGHCNVITEESEQLSSKPYQCTIGECGKRYKNLNGLKYHIEHSHMAALNSTLAAAAAVSFGPSPLITPETSPLMSSLSSMN